MRVDANVSLAGENWNGERTEIKNMNRYGSYRLVDQYPSTVSLMSRARLNMRLNDKGK